MTDTPPPWHRVRSVIDAAVDLGTTPVGVHNLDQMQGWITHRLDLLELDVRAPERLYEVFVVLGVLYEFAAGAAHAELLEREAEVGVKRVALTFAAALSRLLPEEARS